MDRHEPQPEPMETAQGDGVWVLICKHCPESQLIPGTSQAVAAAQTTHRHRCACWTPANALGQCLCPANWSVQRKLACLQECPRRQ
jgi:hypothetical protein